MELGRHSFPLFFFNFVVFVFVFFFMVGLEHIDISLGRDIFVFSFLAVFGHFWSFSSSGRQ